jgi:hypothetical protein
MNSGTEVTIKASGTNDALTYMGPMEPVVLSRAHPNAAAQKWLMIPHPQEVDMYLLRSKADPNYCLDVYDETSASPIAYPETTGRITGKNRLWKIIPPRNCDTLPTQQRIIRGGNSLYLSYVPGRAMVGYSMKPQTWLIAEV